MAVGSTITSVFPGAADACKAFFPMDEEIQEIPAPLVLNELERMYQTVRDIRNEGILHDAHIEQLVAIQEVLNKLYPKRMVTSP